MKTYRCMKCGNNLEAELDIGLVCHICDESSGFIEVTEKNIGKIPFPTHMHKYNPDFDPNICNDRPGFCPCGDFITHPITEPCNIINGEVEKQTRTWDCQCTTAFCSCGAYVAHKVDEPCIAKGI